MTACRWSSVPYLGRLPRPIVTGHGVYQERSGFLLVVRDADGIVGRGDVAPLAGFSTETVEDAMARWIAIQSEVTRWRIPATRQELSILSPDFDRLTAGLPSLRYGLETALGDLASRRAGIAMARCLSGDCGEDVEVNALLAGDDPAILTEQAQLAFSNGFRTFKMKVAVGSVRRDMERVTAVRKAVAKANLRIDANEGWTESQVQEAFPVLRELSLEFVEQPFPAGQAARARHFS